MADLEVYTNIGCKYCEATKRLFKEAGVSFTEHALHEMSPEEEEKTREFFRAEGFKQIPVVIYGDTSWGGWDKAKINEVIEAEKASV